MFDEKNIEDERLFENDIISSLVIKNQAMIDDTMAMKKSIGSILLARFS